MLKVKNLTRKFQSGDHEIAAINNISFEVAEGIFASIVGKSGSGKSTLLSLLGALDLPTSGSVEVDGRDIATFSEGEQTKYRATSIGFVFQHYNLIPNLTAAENVALALEFGNYHGDSTERVKTVLNQVGLTGDKQQRRPGRLSGGEQQRVAIARALANSPKLILADEPTGNLDSQTGKMIFDLLHTLTREQKTTIIAVTHDLSIAGKTDQTLRLRDGQLVGNKEMVSGKGE